MIIIDGAQSEKSITAFANLEELLKDVMQEDNMVNRVVTDVFDQTTKRFPKSTRIRPKILPALIFLPLRCVPYLWPKWPWKCRPKWARWRR